MVEPRCPWQDVLRCTVQVLPRSFQTVGLRTRIDFCEVALPQ